MFAAEVGMEVPLYNAAMLCEENQVRLNCIKYYKVRLHVVSPYNESPLSKYREPTLIASSCCLVCCTIAFWQRGNWGESKKTDESGEWWERLLRRLLQLLCLKFNNIFNPVYNVILCSNVRMS